MTLTLAVFSASLSKLHLCCANTTQTKIPLGILFHSGIMQSFILSPVLWLVEHMVGASIVVRTSLGGRSCPSLIFCQDKRLKQASFKMYEKQKGVQNQERDQST